MTTNLPMEGINFPPFVLDMNDIGTIRRGGLLLLETAVVATGGLALGIGVSLQQIKVVDFGLPDLSLFWKILLGAVLAFVGLPPFLGLSGKIAKWFKGFERACNEEVDARSGAIGLQGRKIGGKR